MKGLIDLKTSGVNIDNYLIPADAFIRSMAVNRERPVCILLGAGASISSGMPSAERCIWEWKKDIFITNNPTLRDSVGELSLPGTRQRIQNWLDQRGQYPILECPSEYSSYAQECYPTSKDRRSFFQAYVKRAKPHTGYRLLPLLAKASLVRTVWTTNFDGLIGRACAAANLVCIEIGIDTVHRTTRQSTDGELRVISLHGDYRYDDLKNTEIELQAQEGDLCKEFLHELRDYDLLVIGYSGRDKSLMTILEQSFTETNQTRLFWCGLGQEISEPVKNLIRKARSVGREVFFVPTEGFDDIISRLALRLLDNELLSDSKNVLASSITSVSAPAAFSVPKLAASSLVKSNAYPLICPSNVLKLDLTFPVGVNHRDWLDMQVPKSLGSLVAIEGGALALSDSLIIQQTFARFLCRNPITVALSEQDLTLDLRVRSLLSRALIRALSSITNSETDDIRRIWDSHSYTSKTNERATYLIHRALSCQLVSLEQRTHVVIMPEIIVKMPNGEIASPEANKVLRNAIYGYQHNNVFDDDLKYWTSKIVDLDIPAFGGEKFRIARAPIYAGLVQKEKPSLPMEMQRFAKQSGLVVADANLIFSSLDGKTETKNPNPLKGLVNNKPWDFQLTTSGLSPTVEIATICTHADSPKLKRFLGLFQEKVQPAKSERDYLQDFPGFSAAFGLPLTYPNPGDASWLDLDDSVTGDTLSAAKQLVQRICHALDVIRGLRPGAVVAIFIPSRWDPFKIIEEENEHFNLHDFLKAYAARQGQSTQFIREETTLTPQPCRVRWWLSLALYAKALRTPWRMDSIDDETAFVGIGYSIDLAANVGKHILLGCSHLYSSRGEGLQFRLGRIENPIIRRRNPFMSEDDARRTGETIRQLFFDSKMCLPKRVVVHKRTYFTAEEQKGILLGLEGVENVELIEINIEESLRYLASKLMNGKLVIDNYPIQRGAVIVQNDHDALLWVHGSAPSSENPNYRYYQGKRRIPAPLLLRRYRGQSDIVQVATEILGLSKMNWNTFDYYSRLPATLESASSIAKIGTYLSGFGSAPYDYRLLI